MQAVRRFVIAGESTNLINKLEEDVTRLKNELNLLIECENSEGVTKKAQCFLGPEMKFCSDSVYRIIFEKKIPPEKRIGVTTFNNCIYCLYSITILCNPGTKGSIKFDLDVPGIKPISFFSVCAFYLDAYNEPNCYEPSKGCMLRNMNSDQFNQMRANLSLSIEYKSIALASFLN